jgi:uncharacterized protein (DUF1697 family)
MSNSKANSAIYLGLLRGINVGGKNKLPMKDLAQIFTAAGCVDVKTYIQSGNVIFQAGPDAAARLPVLVTAAIAERFGYAVPLVMRTAGEIARVLRDNPFVNAGASEDELYVLFLADVPERHRVEKLDPNRSPPDAFAVRGREVYLRLVNGAGTSKLTNAYFDSKLATVSTARNWRTVNKLFELTRS